MKGYPTSQIGSDGQHSLGMSAQGRAVAEQLTQPVGLAERAKAVVARFVKMAEEHGHHRGRSLGRLRHKNGIAGQAARQRQDVGAGATLGMDHRQVVAPVAGPVSAQGLDQGGLSRHRASRKQQNAGSPGHHAGMNHDALAAVFGHPQVKMIGQLGLGPSLAGGALEGLVVAPSLIQPVAEPGHPEARQARRGSDHERLRRQVAVTKMVYLLGREPGHHHLDALEHIPDLYHAVHDCL